MSHINIVFDGPPGPEAGRFVEVEDDEGRSIKIGEWVEYEGGYWALSILDPEEQTAELKQYRRAAKTLSKGWSEFIENDGEIDTLRDGMLELWAAMGVRT